MPSRLNIGYAFSLSRAVYFFPFFLIGYLYKKQIIDLSKKFRILHAAAFFAISIGIIYWSINGLPYTSLFGSNSYALAPVLQDFPLTGRLFVLLLSLVSAVSFFSLINSSKVLAYIGERSLTIFLLHGFLIKITAAVVGKFTVSPQPALLLLWISLALLISFSLAPFDKWLAKFYGATAKIAFNKGRHAT